MRGLTPDDSRTVTTPPEFAEPDASKLAPEPEQIAAAPMEQPSAQNYPQLEKGFKAFLSVLSHKWGIPTWFLLAVAWAESRFGQECKGANNWTAVENGRPGSPVANCGNVAASFDTFCFGLREYYPQVIEALGDQMTAVLFYAGARHPGDMAFEKEITDFIQTYKEV